MKSVSLSKYIHPKTLSFADKLCIMLDVGTGPDRSRQLISSQYCLVKEVITDAKVQATNISKEHGRRPWRCRFPEHHSRFRSRQGRHNRSQRANHPRHHRPWQPMSQRHPALITVRPTAVHCRLRRPKGPTARRKNPGRQALRQHRLRYV